MNGEEHVGALRHVMTVSLPVSLSLCHLSRHVGIENVRNVFLSFFFVLQMCSDMNQFVPSASLIFTFGSRPLGCVTAILIPHLN